MNVDYNQILELSKSLIEEQKQYSKKKKYNDLSLQDFNAKMAEDYEYLNSLFPSIFQLCVSGKIDVNILTFMIEQANNIKNNNITITEVNISPDLKNAKAYVLPLGGKNAEETVEKLKKYSFLIRKTLSKKIVMKFLPKIFFAKDNSFDYAEKIENLIKQTNK